MKRYDLGLEGPCLELERSVMQESPDGEYVRFDDVQHLLSALQEIAAYDRISDLTEDGVCPYGCDTPWIAKKALGIACDVPSETGNGH